MDGLFFFKAACYVQTHISIQRTIQKNNHLMAFKSTSMCVLSVGLAFHLLNLVLQRSAIFATKRG